MACFIAIYHGPCSEILPYYPVHVNTSPPTSAHPRPWFNAPHSPYHLQTHGVFDDGLPRAVLSERTSCVSGELYICTLPCVSHQSQGATKRLKIQVFEHLRFASEIDELSFNFLNLYSFHLNSNCHMWRVATSEVPENSLRAGIIFSFVSCHTCPFPKQSEAFDKSF